MDASCGENIFARGLKCSCSECQVLELGGVMDDDIR